MQVKGVSSHHTLCEMSCKLKVTVSGIIFGPPSLIPFIRQFLKLPDNLWNVLYTDISYGIPCLFVFLWPYFDLGTQRSNWPLSWSSQIIFWLWICDFHIVQTAKLQWYFHGDFLITTLDLSEFSNILMNTIFHAHSWELTKFELSLPERIRVDQP